MLLRLLGADVRVVHSGAEALAALRDLSTRRRAARHRHAGHGRPRSRARIREQPSYEDVVLVALTGWGQEEDRRRSRHAGFDHHLIKPAALVDLQATSRRARTRRAPYRPPEHHAT